MKNLNEYGPARDKVDAPSYAARGEDGRLHGDGIEYEVADKKVTASMSGYQSQKYTKLAKKVQEAKRLSDELAILKEEIKSDTREHVADLFAAEDATRTRVIETVSFTMKLNANPKPTESYKYAEIVKALEEELTPELLTVLETLKKKFKTVTQKEASLSVELKEGLWDSIVSGFKKLYSAIMSWAKSYDKKLNELKKQAATLVFESEEMENGDGSNIETEGLPFPVGTMVYGGTKSGTLIGWAPNKEYVFVKDGLKTATIHVDSLTDEKPSFFQKAASWVMGEGIDGASSFQVGPDSYSVKKRVMGQSLESGMDLIVYDGTRTIPYSIIDFLDEKTGRRYSSVKGMMAANNVKSLSALGEVTTAYINVTDLEDKTSGEWFYLHNGRWVIGSGASPLSFTELGARINESGSPKLVGKGKKFETKRELVTESIKADIYIVAVPHVSDVGEDTQVVMVRGFSLDGSTDCIACSAREALSGIESDLNSLPSDKVLTLVSVDDQTGEPQASIWYEDGAWRDANGEVKIYQVGEVESNGIPDTNYGDFTLVSKWALPSGKQVQVVKDLDQQAFIVDDKGFSHHSESPMSVVDLENLITKRGGTPIPMDKLSESIATVIREFVVDPSDSFPIPATLDDEELEVHLKRWAIDKRYVDDSTEEGIAYSAFGKELEDEAKERGIA